MRCHLPVLRPLGITPKRLICNCERPEHAAVSSGLNIQPSDSSNCKYSVNHLLVLEGGVHVRRHGLQLGGPIETYPKTEMQTITDVPCECLVWMCLQDFGPLMHQQRGADWVVSEFPCSSGQKSKQSESAVYGYSCVRFGVQVMRVYAQDRLLKLAMSRHTPGVEITIHLS